MAGWWVVWQAVLVPLLYCQWARQTEPLLKHQTNRSQVKTQHLVSPSQICLKNLVYVQVCLENWVYIQVCLENWIPILLCHLYLLNTNFFLISLLSQSMRYQMLMKARYLTTMINWLFLCPDIKLSSKLRFTKSTKNWCPWIVMKNTVVLNLYANYQ